jgi:hypothetical protein
MYVYRINNLIIIFSGIYPELKQLPFHPLDSSSLNNQRVVMDGSNRESHIQLGAEEPICVEA